MADKTMFNAANIVKDIEKLLTGDSSLPGLETPDISITDDIGECEGFKELINAKISGNQETGVTPELNADKYLSFDSNKKSHEFLIDYKYKDISSAGSVMRDYEKLNTLYGYSQSFDSMVELSVEDGIALSLKAVVANYKRLYNDSVKLLKEKGVRNLKELDDPALRIEIDNLTKYEDMEITRINPDVVTPSSTYPGTMMVTYGPYYRYSDGMTEAQKRQAQHSGNGIDIALTKKDIVRSIEAGTITKIKTSFGKNGDRLANYVKVKSDIDGSIVTYKHITGNLKENTKIAAGAILGQFDNSGFTSSGKPVGAHLHMEAVNSKGETVKILQYIAERQKRLKIVFAPKGKESTIKAGSSESVSMHVSDIYKKLDPGGYNLVMERSKIIVPKEGETGTGIAQSTGTSYILKGKPEIQQKVSQVLDMIQAKTETVFKDIFEDRLTSIYKVYTYDFSKKIEDININITPGSCGKILMQGENAPFIQSTGGRTKSATVTFTINSVADLARLSMLFKVVNSTDHQVSMLLLTRSAYKAGRTKVRLRHITEYMLQENFERTIKNIIGKKLPPRFDEPVTIRNEFLNALGISSCIPVSLEIKTMEENPGAYQVLITFNAINLGNRNLENLKKMKAGSNIPILPLATRLSLKDELHNEVTSTVFNEKKLLSVVGTMATKQALAEFLPIYIIAKIKRMKDNIQAMSALTGSVDIDDVLTRSLMLSNRGFDNNLSVMEKVIEDTMGRRMAGDISFNTYGETVTDGLAFAGAIYGSVKAGGVDKIKTGAQLAKEVGKTLKTGFIGAGTGAAGMIVVADTAAAISDPQYGYLDEQQKNFLNFNLLTMLPVYLDELIMEYFANIKDNNVERFIYGCAEECALFIKGVGNVGGEENVISKFGKPVIFKSSGKEKEFHGIRLFINAAGYSLDQGVEKIDKLLLEAGKKYQDLERSGAGLGSCVEKLMHISALMLDHWALTLTKEINLTLTDSGGSGVFTSAAAAANPGSGGTQKIVTGLNGIKATAELIMNSSADIYLRQIREAIVAVITSAQIDVLTGTFLTGDSTNVNSSTIPALSSNQEYQIFREKLKMTQSLGTQICKKYNIRSEILSGSIVTDEFASNEVRQFTGYSGMIIMQALSKKLAAGDELDDIKIPSTAELMDIILPDRAKAITKLLSHFCKKLWEIMKECNIIEIIVLAVVGAVLAKLAAIVGGIGGIILGAIALIVRFARYIVEFGGFIYSILLSMFKKGANIILRKGNLLKISVYLSNLVRAGIAHSTLIEVGVETRIWFKDLLYFGQDVNDQNQTSYIDFPVFTYMGEAMMPDFWVNKIGFIEDSYHGMMQSLQTITELTMENQKACSSNDYRTLLNKFKERLSGVDSGAVRKAELEFHNNLKYSITNDSGDLYFGPVYNDSDPRIISVANTIANFGAVINSYINKIVGKQDSNFGFGYTYIKVYAKNGQLLSNVMQYSIDINRCAFIIDVYPDKCKITPTSILSDITKALGTAGAAPTVDQSTSLAIPGSYSESMAKQTILTIVNLLGTLRDVNRTKVELMEAMEADTVNNLMMLKTLVGSAMTAVGKPGVSYMKTLLQDNTRAMIRNTLYLRAGYMYPTLKLFFIEEDSEAYYLFDDLYSYASVIDFSISDDLDSPIQVMKLNVTNIYGHLDDISSDKYPEYSFASDHEANSALNSIMLKTGCKIKLQAGYTTLMDEGCTIFTGRISNIQFGEITQIEATSMGDSFMEEVSLEKVKIYGDDMAAGENDWFRALWSKTLNATGNLIGDGTYETPLSSIKKIIGYVLTDATLKGKLDDYTISPDLQADFDREVQVASSDYMVSIKNKFFPNVIDQMFNTGGMKVKTSFNKQLFENVNISDGDIMEVGGLFGQLTALRQKSTIWTSLNQTTWDIMQEINMLLPNNLVRVLPYETRSTLVWGGENGFYRYKRSSDYSTMISTALADKLRFSIESKPKFQTILATAMANFQLGYIQGIWEPFESSMALLCLVTDYANNLALAYSATKDSKPKIDGVKENLDILNPGSLKDIMKWMYIPWDGRLLEGMKKLHENHVAAMKAYNIAMDNARKENSGDAAKNIPLSDISLSELSKPTTGYEKAYDGGPLDYQENKALTWQQSMMLKMIFLEFASEYYMDLMFKTAATTSSSYKRISDTHMKMSGRDIIRNNISLMEPYNAVKVTYPSTDMDDVISNLEEDSRTDTPPIPIHYKLEPRVWKVYSTFFRNINIFPSARNSVLAMFTSSCLTNLIKQSYGGNIITFGDPKVKAGDKVFIYDENTDLYGFIEVAKCVHVFSQEQGFVTIITPSMVARNESALKECVTDILGNLVTTIKYIFLVGLIYRFGTAAKGAISKTEKGKKAVDFIERRIKHISTLSKGLRSAADQATGGRIFSGSRSEMALWQLEKADGGAAKIDKILQSVASEKVSIEKAIHDGNIADHLHKTLAKEVDSFGKTMTIDISTIESKHITEALAKSTDDIFNIANRTDKNISEKIMTGFEKELRSILKPHIPEGKEVPEELVKKIMDSIKNDKIAGFSNYGQWSDKINKQFMEFDQKTKTLAEGIDVTGTNINKDDLVESLKILTENVAFTGKSVWNELGGIGLRAGKTGFGYLMASELIDTMREIADLKLKNELTAHNVTITPLFFRGEPFVSNLDGMDKQDGERAGLIDIIRTRSGQAMRGLVSAVNDPYEDLKTKYNRILRETAGRENLGTYTNTFTR